MGRLMGLDIGDRRIGIALSDMGRRIASPHSVYQRVGYGPDTRFLSALAQEHEVAYVVAGLPRNMDGSLGEQAQKAQAFCQQLEQAGLRVEYIDERLTTKAAQMALLESGVRREGRRDRVDKVAAALILQSYLDRGETPPPSAAGANNKEETPMDKNRKDLPETEVIEEAFDMDDNVVELTDEDGVTSLFEYQATIEMEGEEYIVLMELPGEDEELDEDEGTVVIMKIDQDDQGEDIYVSVDDEETMQAVFDLFLEHLDEEEEGELEEDE